MYLIYIIKTHFHYLFYANRPCPLLSLLQEWIFKVKFLESDQEVDCRRVEGLFSSRLEFQVTKFGFRVAILEFQVTPSISAFGHQDI